jgi:quinohemoprotein ethanol dehydrogenase
VLYNESVWNVVTAYDGATGASCGPTIRRSTASGRGSPAAARLARHRAWNGKDLHRRARRAADRRRREDRREVWSVADLRDDLAYSITGAPRVFDGKVVIGNGGADYGVRGFVAAYDAETGEQLWKFYIVPGNPADGPDGEASDSVMPMAAKTWTGSGGSTAAAAPRGIRSSTIPS